jgi:hypothetical protein
MEIVMMTVMMIMVLVLMVMIVVMINVVLARHIRVTKALQIKIQQPTQISFSYTSKSSAMLAWLFLICLRVASHRALRCHFTRASNNYECKDSKLVTGLLPRRSWTSLGAAAHLSAACARILRDNARDER